MKLFLGVDGGQSTTKVVLGDAEMRIVAQSTGGPSNHTEEPGGPERLERVVRETVASALAAIKAPHIGECEFAAACFGMTGEVVIKRRILESFIRTPHLSVVHDSVNALIGATAGAPGINVIAGTGSVASGVNAEGRESRVGGWGYTFGDEGSAYFIGKAAVSAVSAEEDGMGPKTALTAILLGRLGVDSASALRAHYYAGTWPREHLAGLAGWVNEAAEGGDAVALRILQHAGKDLAGFAGILLDRLFPAAPSAQAGANRPLVCCSGGVFQSRAVMSAFQETIRNKRPEAETRPALLPPVLGSLLMAYRAAGVQVSEKTYLDWVNKLQE
ncbi:MAG: ATPase [Acidobacteriia bacterium]|nr:ATPase [Terriglobia bacterium]